jgi:5-methylcytosine-specific restriction endonuclease McrA
MNDKYLYLICSPDKWFGKKSEQNYKTNEMLKTLSVASWHVNNLKSIYVGMLGIIKVSKDKRPLYFLEEHNVSKLESGIYATFEVLEFNRYDDGNEVTIKVIDNLFAQNRQISKEQSEKILGSKFTSLSQGYIDKSVYDAVYETIGEIEYQDLPRKRKSLTLEEAKEVYPRDENEKKEALILANYKCEVDQNHTTFISKQTEENYVEGHHLIPISQYAEFENDVDVKANIVSLCPTCHRKLHSGIKQDVDEVLEVLYKKREDRLTKVGLEITLEDLKYIYSEVM